ncbi:MAG: phosphoglucosamine mutase [Desulfatirhabdiaceae bacterium]
MPTLFGTDGIRNAVNVYPMTAEMVLSIGKGFGRFFADNGSASIVIGKDTRLSGDMFEHALAAGISASGMDVLMMGVIPTPGVAYAVRSLQAAAGIVISASHNPWTDNGIKVFDSKGFKLSESLETSLEQMILDDALPPTKTFPEQSGQIRYFHDADTGYRDFLIQSASEDFSLKGIKIVLDCANGATAQVAPDVFARLGAHVEILSAHPDGRNINDRCGSEQPSALAAHVQKTCAAVGFAFDGDGDRVVVCDETGTILTGDQAIAICARHFKESGRLRNNLVVTTVMSNMGLRSALRKLDIQHVAARVGDRHVMEAMKKNGSVLGGEDSGHLIFLDRHTTGDGILSALQILDIMTSENQSLSDLKQIMTVFPQVLINVQVKAKPDIESLPGVLRTIQSVESRLGKEGRVLVRYSGTQPLCRVMVEGPTLSQVQSFCQTIADTIKNVIG